MASTIGLGNDRDKRIMPNVQDVQLERPFPVLAVVLQNVNI